jgi:serine/threonine-protein kinase
MLTQIGKYRIERELGRGAMGVVYKAFDPVVERAVAIKTIRLDVENAEDLVTRLRREAKSVGQLEHPNIVTLYDAGESSGLFYLAMQFIQGETLQDAMTRQGWFPLREVLEIFRQICAGLDYAHQHGVIHRDIKPANIMVTREGAVKLTDFGIAKVAGTGTTSTGLVVGTPSYMSPEQALGRPLDGRSDIFSLGSILYEMMTGEKAFAGQNVTTVIYKIVHEPPTPLVVLQPGLDPSVEAIVLKALAKGPDQRYQNCGELAAELERYIERAATAIPKTSVVTPPRVSAVQQPVAGASTTPVPGIPPTPSGSTVSTPPTAASSGGIPIAPPTASGQVPAMGLSATASQPMVRQGVPLAWVGGGVIGTLLLVVVILLIVQMRQPSPAPAPTQTAAVDTVLPATETAAAKPAVNKTQPAEPVRSAASKPPSPAPTRRASEQPAPARREVNPLSSAVGRRTAPKQDPLSRAASSSPTAAPPQKPPPSPSTSPATGSEAETETAAPSAPETFSAVMLKGDMAFQEGQYQKAYAHYLKAYRMNPGSREVKRKLVMILTLLGKPEEALKYK